MNIFRCLLITVYCLFFGISGAAIAEESAGTTRVLLTPFDITSAAHYAYLQDSVQSMVASRLANRDRVTIVDQQVSKKELDSLNGSAGMATKTELRMLLNADYVLKGNLFALPSGLNVQIDLYPIQADRQIRHYSIIVKKPENLITEIERLVTEIANENFTITQKQSPVIGKADKDTAASAFMTAHPEAAYKRSKLTGTVLNNAEGEIIAKTVGNQKLFSLAGDVQSLEVVDADNDQQDDIFALMGGSVQVFHIAGDSLQTVGEFTLPVSMACHSMQFADLNGDRLVELYLSATDGLAVSSMILSWSLEKGFVALQSHIPFYLRPLSVPGKGWQLLGQERGQERIDFVKTGVYFMKSLAGGEFTLGEQLALPPGVNLFDFVFADLDGDKSSELVTIDQQEKIRVYNGALQLLWVSDKNFGGSKATIGPQLNETEEHATSTTLSENEAIARRYIFVPGRLVVTDVNNDGKQEIVVAENVPSSWNLMKRFRLYKEGSVVALSWRGDALQAQWRTGLFDDYVADFNFQYATNAASRIFIVYRSAKGSLTSFLPGLNNSEISVYELLFSAKKAE